MYDIETLSVMRNDRGRYDGAICPPVFFSAAFEGGGKYSYSRLSNPTRDALQNTLSKLEGGRHALAFSSGMAAVHAVLTLLKPGDRAVISRDCYGGTLRLSQKVLCDSGIDFIYIDPCDTCEAARACEGAKLMLVETPSNPLLKVCDIKKLAEICRYNGVLLAVDNTFMTPFLQNPLSLGADIVIHSATKYLCGHHDAMGGTVVLNDDEIYQKLSLISNTCGIMLDSFDCFLIHRGIETLHLRMSRHCLAAKRLADMLKKHPAVDSVTYPGDDPVNAKQSRGGGGMLSFKLKQGADIQKVLHSGNLIKFGESLGGSVSLITHPKTQTHASLTETQRANLGITDTLLRLSPGLENIDDLVTDLMNMLDNAF